MSVAKRMTPPGMPDTWDNVFMSMALAIAMRSKDPRTKHGAVLVDCMNRVVSVGFNGPPPRIDDDKINWGRPAKYAWVIHAEENALRFGCQARGAVGLYGTRMYVTGPPCPRCLLRIVAHDVEEVIHGSRQSACITDEDRATSAEILRLSGLRMRLY